MQWVFAGVPQTALLLVPLTPFASHVCPFFFFILFFHDFPQAFD